MTCTCWRRNATEARAIAKFMVLAAVIVMLVAWCLYVPGLIGADVFVWLLKFALGLVLGLVVQFPAYVLIATFLDGRRARRNQR